MTDREIQAVRRRRVGSTIMTEVRRGQTPAASEDSENREDWEDWPGDQSPPLGLPAVPAWRDDDAARRGEGVLPFAPISFRDFMLYEQHVVDASRAMTRRYRPGAARFASAYETLRRATFPAFKPAALWYREPIYYMSNALTFIASGTSVSAPDYATDFDYELELGFVINRPLRDASPREAVDAIAGYVVLNDLSARNVQLREMGSGFGPQKAKHFASSMSDTLVAAAAIPDPRALTARVTINGAVVATGSTSGMQHSLGEALAHASRGEQLYPGELFGTGTLPGCTGIENGHLLHPGDRLELTIDGVGHVAHDVNANSPTPTTRQP